MSVFNLTAKVRAWRARQAQRKITEAARLMAEVSKAKAAIPVHVTTAKLKQELADRRACLEAGA
jgi:hypothetical protein